MSTSDLTPASGEMAAVEAVPTTIETAAHVALSRWVCVAASAANPAGEMVADEEPIGRRTARLDVRIPQGDDRVASKRAAEAVAAMLGAGPPWPCAGGPFRNSWIVRVERVLS